MQLNAPVAQLDRVLVSEAKGRGFDSRRARHNIYCNQQVNIFKHPCIYPNYPYFPMLTVNRL